MGRGEFGSYRSFITVSNAIKVEMVINTPIHAWFGSIPVVAGEVAIVAA